MTLREEIVNLAEELKAQKGFENPEKQKWIKTFILNRLNHTDKELHEIFNDLLSVKLDKSKGFHTAKEESDFWRSTESDKWCNQARTAINKFLGQNWVDKFDKWVKEAKKLALS